MFFFLFLLVYLLLCFYFYFFLPLFLLYFTSFSWLNASPGLQGEKGGVTKSGGIYKYLQIYISCILSILAINICNFQQILNPAALLQFGLFVTGYFVSRGRLENILDFFKLRSMEKSYCSYFDASIFIFMFRFVDWLSV